MPVLAIYPLWLILLCPECGMEISRRELEVIVRTRDIPPSPLTTIRPTPPGDPRTKRVRAPPPFDAPDEDLAALAARRRAFGVVTE